MWLKGINLGTLNLFLAHWKLMMPSFFFFRQLHMYYSLRKNLRDRIEKCVPIRGCIVPFLELQTIQQEMSVFRQTFIKKGKIQALWDKMSPCTCVTMETLKGHCSDAHYVWAGKWYNLSLTAFKSNLLSGGFFVSIKTVGGKNLCYQVFTTAYNIRMWVQGSGSH